MKIIIENESLFNMFLSQTLSYMLEDFKNDKTPIQKD